MSIQTQQIKAQNAAVYLTDPDGFPQGKSGETYAKTRQHRIHLKKINRSYYHHQEKTMVFVKQIILILSTLIAFTGCAPPEIESNTNDKAVSGTLLNGYRIIDMSQEIQSFHLTVYRGDYIKFKINPSVKEVLVSIPALGISTTVETNVEKTPFFKMKTVGVFPLTLGTLKGNIQIIEYSEAHYTELSTEDSQKFIKNVNPLILDVRTEREFKRGHLEKAVLVPVQSLQKRLVEFSHRKHDNILIYCATGNRSTVASKILIDAGFKRIFNMRRGIADWAGKKQPIVR